jgi:hypothetical protein
MRVMVTAAASRQLEHRGNRGSSTGPSHRVQARSIRLVIAGRRAGIGLGGSTFSGFGFDVCGLLGLVEARGFCGWVARHSFWRRRVHARHWLCNLSEALASGPKRDLGFDWPQAVQIFWP